MNHVRSNSLSLKYQGFPPSDCQDIGIIKFEFVAKTQFLYLAYRGQKYFYLSRNTKLILCCQFNWKCLNLKI